MKLGRTILVGLSLLVLGELGRPARPVHAFNDRAHTYLSGMTFNAVQSSLDDVLKAQLGLLFGTGESLGGLSGVEWIIKGALDEDSPATRVFAHFHDPAQLFEQAGLFGRFESAAVWGQDRTQGRLPYLGGKHSWFDARASFHRALTATTDGDRRRALGETFFSLGHLIHLIQDQASPAHTRNDAHLSYSGIGDVDGFHTFGETDRGLLGIVTSASAPPDASVLRPDPSAPRNPAAPDRIARLVDTERLRAARAAEGGTDIGIAEFSSANFLSDGAIAGTIFTRPLPSRSSADLMELVESKTQERRLYLVKTREGATGYRLAAVSVFGNFLAVSLDDDTYADYGRMLFPRAIGYGASLIEHFFRGRIEIAAPDRYVYGLAPFVDGNTGAFTKLAFKVRNATAGDEPAGVGTITAVVRYRKGLADLTVNPIPVSNEVFLAVSAPQAVALGPAFTPLTFDFGASPIPTNSADLYLTVVYRGPLGDEEDAVAVGARDLFEPDPVDVANITDYDCIGIEPQHVADFTAFPPFDFANRDPVTNPQVRDLSEPKDGFPEMVGPIDEVNGVFMKVSSLQQPILPSPTQFDYMVPQRIARPGPQYTRFFLLQDQPFYNLTWLIGNTVFRGTQPGLVGFSQFITTFPTANVNRIFVDPIGRLVHRVTLPNLYRGLSSINLSTLVTDVARFNACFANTVALPPSPVRIEGELAAP